MTKADRLKLQIGSVLSALDRQCFASPWSREQIARELQKTGAIWCLGMDTKIFHCNLDTSIPKGCDSLWHSYSIWNYSSAQECIDLLRMGVLPDQRKRGVATWHLRKAHNTFLEYRLNFKSCLLEVHHQNLAAIRCYQNAGYQEIHQRKNYYGKDAALIMQWLKR